MKIEPKTIPDLNHREFCDECGKTIYEGERYWETGDGRERKTYCRERCLAAHQSREVKIKQPEPLLMALSLQTLETMLGNYGLFDRAVRTVRLGGRLTVIYFCV